MVPLTFFATTKIHLTPIFCIHFLFPHFKTPYILLDFNILSTSKVRSKVAFMWRSDWMLYTLQKRCKTDTKEKWVGSADYHRIKCTSDIYFHFLKLLNELADFQGPQLQVMPYADSRTYNYRQFNIKPTWCHIPLPSHNTLLTVMPCRWLFRVRRSLISPLLRFKYFSEYFTVKHIQFVLPKHHNLFHNILWHILHSLQLKSSHSHRFFSCFL
jgi:hypothetical protein